MMYLVYAGLIVFGAFFTGAAAMKLARHQHFIEEFDKMQMPYFLAYISGAVEIICGPALIAGIWFPAAAGVASAVMFWVMIGAAVINLLAKGRGMRLALGILVIFALPMLLIALYHQGITRELLGI